MFRSNEGSATKTLPHLIVDVDGVPDVVAGSCHAEPCHRVDSTTNAIAGVQRLARWRYAVVETITDCFSTHPAEGVPYHEVNSIRSSSIPG
jgi:hypothetical protein